jgi:hypothetical protein
MISVERVFAVAIEQRQLWVARHGVDDPAVALRTQIQSCVGL